MKKLILLPVLFAAALVLSITACQKENDVVPAVSEGIELNTATDRTGPTPVDPCFNRSTVTYSGLAAKKSIYYNAFKPGWKLGELDRIANDCVLGEFPGNCSDGGTALFYGLPQFHLYNFMDANGNFPPAQQDAIIQQALAYAATHITGCGENLTPTIYLIDFTIFPSSGFGGEEVQFAVKYACCPGGVGE